MKIGFTGTRNGMTPSQKLMLRDLLPRDGRQSEFHHGDCIGADADACEIAKPFMVLISHPPSSPIMRAYKMSDQVRPEKPYIVRNHDIVDETEWLIAAPNGYEEVIRSGTWATIRYARKLKRRISIIGPDGELL